MPLAVEFAYSEPSPSWPAHVAAGLLPDGQTPAPRPARKGHSPVCGSPPRLCPLGPAHFGELQHWVVGCQACAPPPCPQESLQREQRGQGGGPGPELGAEASFLSLSCRWGPLRAWHSACPPPPRDERPGASKHSAPPGRARGQATSPSRRLSPNAGPPGPARPCRPSRAPGGAACRADLAARRAVWPGLCHMAPLAGPRELRVERGVPGRHPVVPGVEACSRLLRLVPVSLGHWVTVSLGRAQG